LALTIALPGLGAAAAETAADTAFTGSHGAWHGFDRYDFVMDTTTLAPVPFTPPPGERDGIGAPKPGTRRCVIVVPREAAPGKPWSWRGCYWDHQPQTEIELLRRGWHIGYVSADANLKPGPEWDAWYAFLTAQHGLSPKPAFIGMSRGGEYGLTWAAGHPDRVACVYADNPGGSHDLLLRFGELPANDVPLLLVCGSIDPLLGRFALPFESAYQQAGGRVSVLIKEGAGHHPHSLRDPKPLADWITQNAVPPAIPTPDFVPAKHTRTWFYSSRSDYRDFPAEQNHLTCRGAAFVPCHPRYAFELPGVEGATTVIAPLTPAPGRPWVFRADLVARDAAVDLALLERGFHIVTGPVSYNADGPIVAHWNKVYEHLTAHGFSTKPVLAGAGGAAGEALNWAIQNPDKTACVYAENPVFRSRNPDHSLLENLAPLAKLGVPLLAVCGARDPWLEPQSRAAERNYHALGGTMTLLVREGEGHFLQPTRDVTPMLDFIASRTR